MQLADSLPGNALEAGPKAVRNIWLLLQNGSVLYTVVMWGEIQQMEDSLSLSAFQIKNIYIKSLKIKKKN